MRKSDYNYLLKVMEKNAGWSLNNDHYYIIDKKISNFVREKGYLNSDELMADVKNGNKFLIEQLIEEMANSDTMFFRDFGVFKRFSNIVLPNIKESYRSVKKLNIWSCGCSTGQEVYSILIALKNNKFFGDWQLSVMGTDLVSRSLSAASKGFYNNFDVQRGLNIKSIIENFIQKENGWQILPEIQEKAEFRKYNLLDDLIFKNKFDVVFCRNTINYFKPDAQLSIIEKIHTTQPAGGLFYIGLNEQLFGLDNFYEKVVGFECLYQAKKIEKKLSKEDFAKSFSNKEMPSFSRPESLEKFFS